MTAASPERRASDLFKRPAGALRTALRVQGMALPALWAYKLRSFFVVAATALGVAALTIIVASVDGARKKALELVEWFGPDAALVIGGDIRNRPVGQRVLTLSWRDAKAVRDSLPGARFVVPMRAKRNPIVKYGNKNSRVPVVVGVTENYVDTWNWPLSEGRDLTRDDIAHAAKVCLIGDGPAQDLFGDVSPIGGTIRINDLAVRVVGRLAHRGFSGGGGEHTVDDRIIMPITTMTKRFNMDRKYFRALRVKFHDAEHMEEQAENLKSLLRALHGLRPEQPDDFTILTAGEILGFLTMFTGGLVVFLGVTAGVGMLVGGFVLANLMFLSVSERRGEIGLRKALGASPRAIICQFLSEAAYLTLGGAAVGVGLGLALGETLSRFGVLELVLSPKLFVLAAAASLVIALAAGIRPALRAAGMKPIEALRGGG